MIFKTIQDLSESIYLWEYEAGESFTDYYMHDCVNDLEWAAFLDSKGFTERAEAIRSLRKQGNTCLCQSLLYNVHSTYLEEYEGCKEAIDVVEYSEDQAKWQELYLKDIKLWAEFLFNNEYHKKEMLEYPRSWD